MLDIFAEEDDIFSENYTEVSVLSATVCVCVCTCACILISLRRKIASFISTMQ